MPTATLSMTRDGVYILVSFRPKGEWHPIPGTTSLVERVWPVLPVGLYDFSQKGCVQDPHCVSLRLDKCPERGAPDVLTMMTAADWLAEQGWEVEPLGWCKEVFDKVRQLPVAAA